MFSANLNQKLKHKKKWALCTFASASGEIHGLWCLWLCRVSLWHNWIICRAYSQCSKMQIKSYTITPFMWILDYHWSMDQLFALYFLVIFFDRIMYRGKSTNRQSTNFESSHAIEPGFYRWIACFVIWLMGISCIIAMSKLVFKWRGNWIKYQFRR